MTDRDALIAALQWHIDHAAAFPIEEEAQDRLRPFAMPEVAPAAEDHDMPRAALPGQENRPLPPYPKPAPAVRPAPEPAMPGSAAAMVEARKIAAACMTLDDLRAALSAFSGLAICKTATNMVFADGRPDARVMVVGEAPGADEDRIGKPFVGRSGQLLDRMFAAIGLSRTSEDAATALYISNILNWRPPGNRTPDPMEMDICLPFIERHIALVNPEFLVFAGGTACKALAPKLPGIMKARGKWGAYVPNLPIMAAGTPLQKRLEATPEGIPLLPMFHPSYLLRTPAHKKLAWADLLAIKARMSGASL